MTLHAFMHYLYTELNETIESLELQLDTRLDELTDMLDERLTVLDEGSDKLELRVNTSLDMILEKVESLQQQIEQFHSLGLSPDSPAASCAAILINNPSAPSGLYTIGTLGDSSTQYCDMTLSCGGVIGGWLRVADFNTSDSSQQCPSGFIEFTTSQTDNMRTCVRSETALGCSSVEFSTANSQYSRVCGRITAHAIDTTDGILGNNLDDIYLDGVSLTHGTPRQHIWSFAPSNGCNCGSQNGPNIGDNFFCGTITPEACLTSECCSPYFINTLPQPTSDDLEMRVCRNQGRGDEDIAIEVVEIYVQ